MYFVNRQQLENILQYMERLLEEQSKHEYRSFSEFLLLERLTHLTVEAIIDVGNQMIDGFIMRDPGSYEDIIDILTDEKVLPLEQMDDYKEVIRLRKMVVQNYTDIKHEAILSVWKRQIGTLTQFPNRVRKYLDQELGPVSAFANDGVDEKDNDEL
ncbi:hypothetical protein GCM10010954_34730 [Halobacillus andaensis]|uniref:DUF86 domain-containing protein n=1 Tax=Halobacillus andaensis TaxID=1176239 RepID=A0A917BAE2_HALAA|nr:DUF86 domain-containing protein [Halobacillus andaensis]MBP2005581.1 uncharacterized protein YutE (UPF0331/DUF86 family) [Halobacillus andaensis]GGF32586.1 hypothetical protein GCM10010954_34730 [Halobacillus andaensis]